MDKKRALILDDVDLNRNILKGFLHAYHFEVDTAADGMEGMDLIAENTYSLIFSDYEMPNMNGMEFLAKVKKTPAVKDVPFFILSSVDKGEVIDKARSLGATGYMVKPFTKEKMDEVLKKLGFLA